MPSSTRSYVVDASFVARLLQPGYPEVVDLWLTWLGSRGQVSAPSLLVYEVTNALYRSVRARQLGPQLLSASLEELAAMKLDLVTDLALSRRAAELAWELDLPATYDAHYLALAERLDSDLWTCDEKLAKRIGGQFQRIRVPAAPSSR